MTDTHRVQHSLPYITIRPSLGIDPVAGATMSSAPSAGSAGSVGSIDIMIIDADTDCAEALQLLLSDVPGVGYVQTAATAHEAIDALQMQPADGPDVVAYGREILDPDHAPARQVVLLDTKVDQAREAASHETIMALRQHMPEVTIVLLCLYPDSARATVCTIADRCVPKDTSHADLRALIDDLLGQQP